MLIQSLLKEHAETTVRLLGEVERLREIFDASEMEIIDLSHQAMREGWLRSGRYIELEREID